LNSKVILGLVFALSFSLFIGAGHSAYAIDPPVGQGDCNPNSTFSTDGSPHCVCNPGFSNNGGTTTEPFCIKVSVPVGGMGIQIDSTALLLAGVQGSALWMIPAIVVAGAGIGFFTLRKSKKKED
jgi:hypothetical protein